MKYPLFKRRLMEFDMENYYARNTDVWVYGSARHYETFIGLLAAGRGPKKIVADPGRGMDLLILPPARQARKDFIVMHERLVYQAGRFNMELIIGGSRKGLQVLAGHFHHAADTLGEGPDTHTHVDDLEKLLVLPSVFLSIRGPVRDMDSRVQELAPPASEDLLRDMAWRSPELWLPYAALTYRDLHGRLPIKKSFGR
jgi:hypothetical protein